MTRNDLAGVVQALRGANSFVIVSHPSPDGDAIGSTLAVYHLLRALGKDRILCLNDDPVPRIYRWLPGADVLRVSSEVAARLRL